MYVLYIRGGLLRHDGPQREHRNRRYERRDRRREKQVARRPLPPHELAADDRTRDRARPSDTETPADARRSQGRRIERAREGVDSRLAADDAPARGEDEDEEDPDRDAGLPYRRNRDARERERHREHGHEPDAADQPREADGPDRAADLQHRAGEHRRRRRVA